MTPVQVFEADSGDLVIAFLGIMGPDGLLIWRGEKGWEFHEAQSVTWDSLHQAAHRNSRATILDAAARQLARLGSWEAKRRGYALLAGGRQGGC